MILCGHLLLVTTEEGDNIAADPIGEELQEVLNPEHPRFNEVWGLLRDQCSGIFCFSITPLGEGFASKSHNGQWTISCDLEGVLANLLEQPT